MMDIDLDDIACPQRVIDRAKRAGEDLRGREVARRLIAREVDDEEIRCIAGISAEQLEAVNERIAQEEKEYAMMARLDRRARLRYGYQMGVATSLLESGVDDETVLERCDGLTSVDLKMIRNSEYPPS